MSRRLPIVGALVFRPDGSCYNTGTAPTNAQKVLKLGALISDCCDVQAIWMLEFDDLPGFGRLYIQLIYDDSCLLKGLPKNARFPLLAGDVILGCYMDAYKLDSNSCCEDEVLVSLPVLDIFGQKAIDELVKGYRNRSSNMLELKLDQELVKAAFEDASVVCASL